MDQNIFIGIMAAVIIIGFISLRRKKAQCKAQASDAVFNGRYAKGHIVAVKGKTIFDRGEKSHSEIRVHVEFHDPETGELNSYPHHFSRDAENIPACLTRCGNEDVDAAGTVEKHSELKFYRAELESQGRSPSDIKQAVMERAMEKAHGSSGSVAVQADGDGYLPLRESIPVDVYLHPEAPSGNGLHVVFPK